MTVGTTSTSYKSHNGLLSSSKMTVIDFQLFNFSISLSKIGLKLLQKGHQLAMKRAVSLLFSFKNLLSSSSVLISNKESPYSFIVFGYFYLDAIHLCNMALIPKYYKESHSKAGSKLRDFILGWQDGLVNVLGLVLGIATATQDTKLILISGLIAASAEAISMSAVAYTSTKTEIDFYKSELEREKREVGKMPEIERKEIKDIYLKR